MIPSPRERRLLSAAEDVCEKWAIIEAADGRFGAQGLPQALRRLARVLDTYNEEAEPAPRSLTA